MVQKNIEADKLEVVWPIFQSLTACGYASAAFFISFGVKSNFWIEYEIGNACGEIGLTRHKFAYHCMYIKYVIFIQ